MTNTISAAVLGLVNAVLQTVVAFGVNLSDNQNAAITALVNALLFVGVLVYDLRQKANPAPPAPPAPVPPTPPASG